MFDDHEIVGVTSYRRFKKAPESKSFSFSKKEIQVVKVNETQFSKSVISNNCKRLSDIGIGGKAGEKIEFSSQDKRQIVHGIALRIVKIPKEAGAGLRESFRIEICTQREK